MCGYLIAFILGIIIGSIVTNIIFYRKRAGVIRIDQSDPSDPPYLFLELETGLDQVEKSKMVFLSVKKENYLPSK